jgi:quinol monooxygenase YgiN
MFVLLVELEAEQGRSGELESLLSSLVALAEHEPGILFYSVQRPQGDANRFVLYEYYEDKAAWETHLKYEPVQSRLKCLEPLLKAAPKLTLCDAVSTTSIG